jgi:hypothetical protein
MGVIQNKQEQEAVAKGYVIPPAPAPSTPSAQKS